MDITLSISLLASNRKDSLTRCLDSLKPLLVKIPSELIIVWTGTDDKVREIAESYTPQIIPFQWRDDFSAARNAGLKAAKGEWFLYIDDDEWFDDVGEICEFFLSGEYRLYRSAHYIQRNYQNWNGTKHSDFSAFRLVQRFPETHFQGAIHEELTPRMEPCKYFQVCVHHYGYAQGSGNDNVQKTSRNIPLLLQAMENSPEQIKNYLQLAKEYGLTGDWKSAETYCRKGLTVCHSSENPSQAHSSVSDSEGWLLAYLSYLLSKTPGKSAVIAELESLLEQRQPPELIRLVFYQQLIHLYTNEKEPEKAVQYGIKFEKLLKEMDKQENLWIEQGYGEFDENYIKNPEHLYGARADCVACALERKDWENAAYFLKQFPWETEEIVSRYYPDFETWKGNYGPRFSGMLLGILSELADALGNADILNSGAYTDTPSASCLDSPSCNYQGISLYLLLLKALNCLENEKNEAGIHFFVYCMKNARDGYLRRLCIKEAIYHQVSVVPLVSQMPLDTWNHLLEKVVPELPISLNERIRVCAEKTGERYPLHSLCLERSCLEQKLQKGFPLWDELTGTLEAYCSCIVEFYRKLYRDELFQEEACRFLPADCRAAQITLRALEEMGQGQMADSVRLLGEAFHANPNMTGMITELFRQAARRMEQPAIQTGGEFQQLAGQMKDALQALMDTGQTAQAAEILDQLLPLMPEDVEIIRLRQEFIRRAKS